MNKEATVVSHGDFKLDVYKWFRTERNYGLAEAKEASNRWNWSFDDYTVAIKLYEYLNTNPGLENKLFIKDSREPISVPTANCINTDLIEEDLKFIKELGLPIAHQYVKGDGHSCVYSKCINEPRPRLCILCGEEEDEQ